MKRWTPLSTGLLLPGVALLVQSIYLVSVKVTHLGVMLPAALGLALVALALFQPSWSRWLQAARWRVVAWRIALILFAVWLVTLMFFFVWLQRGMVQTASGQAPQAIVVLGASTPGGHPSPTLASRLDRALVLAQTYPDATVVTSGGVDHSESVSEGEVMAQYLVDRGLPRARVHIEGRSSSTHENMVFSRALLQSSGIGPGAPVLVVTSDFHTLRAIRIARKAGLTNVSTAGAQTPLYMRYNAWLREYFAFFSGWLLREY